MNKNVIVDSLKDLANICETGYVMVNKEKLQALISGITKYDEMQKEIYNDLTN